MHTYHIHINGLVQGVGFRPFVCRMAQSFNINGHVSNTNNGVHIECTATLKTASKFYNQLIQHPPVNSLITDHYFEEIPFQNFPSFTIKESCNEAKPDLLLTPDIGLCNDCIYELTDNTNHRHHYPFTTCLQCGPRYSIITKLPYDRVNTTMHALQMCSHCHEEYNNIENRRHYSQTNSCKTCAIPIHLYNSANHCISNDAEIILQKVDEALREGKIVAVKGIGGYLLLCDATNQSTIKLLREKKHRPQKPLALLYADITMAKKDLLIHEAEREALQHPSMPIVLCTIDKNILSATCFEQIAPGSVNAGLMLPSTPLLFLIAQTFGKPLIATSGNMSGSPVIYKDEEALQNLFSVAELIVSFDRDIVVPQDDSVIRFTSDEQKIILRRSRGIAPGYYSHPFPDLQNNILAMGSDLKSAFAIADKKHIYISQYLGNQSTLESQNSYKETLQHLLQLLQFSPSQILIDMHPGYFISQFGIELGEIMNIPVMAVQHHKAHFGAVLAENNLLQINEPILGIIWDGTGYGEDQQIWGGEIFEYKKDQIERIAHFDYFPQLLGDKMSKEPRLAALSLLKNYPEHQSLIKNNFTETEWKYYQQLISQPASLYTSSMGRLLDGIANILGICTFNTYEGEAALKLESLASSSNTRPTTKYQMPLKNNCIQWHQLVTGVIADMQKNIHYSEIAYKVFHSLAALVIDLSNHFQIGYIAFSGGVFQNALLTEMLIEINNGERKLYFHQQLSPNDESIGLGQMACYQMLKKKIKKRNPVLQVENNSTR